MIINVNNTEIQGWRINVYNTQLKGGSICANELTLKTYIKMFYCILEKKKIVGLREKYNLWPGPTFSVTSLHSGHAVSLVSPIRTDIQNKEKKMEKMRRKCLFCKVYKRICTDLNQ